jgi:hypothetical protein
MMIRQDSGTGSISNARQCERTGVAFSKAFHHITKYIYYLFFKFMYDNGHSYKILEDYSQIVQSYIGTLLIVTNNNNNYN